MLLKSSCLQAISAAFFLLGSTACMNQGGALEILVCGGDDHAAEGADHAHEDGTTHYHGGEEGIAPCGGAHAHDEEVAGTGDSTQSPTPKPTDNGTSNQPTVPTPDTTTGTQPSGGSQPTTGGTTTPPPVEDEHAGHDHP